MGQETGNLFTGNVREPQNEELQFRKRESRQDVRRQRAPDMKLTDGSWTWTFTEFSEKKTTTMGTLKVIVKPKSIQLMTSWSIFYEHKDGVA